MISAAEGLDAVRPFAAALVEREERRTGSRMSAYSRVAGAVGVSESWLRKLLGRQTVVVAAHELINFAKAYRTMCDRIEADAERERHLAAALREEADAALESLMGADHRDSGPASSAAGTPPALVGSTRREANRSAVSITGGRR